jgi:hypothetical protein
MKIGLAGHGCDEQDGVTLSPPIKVSIEVSIPPISGSTVALYRWILLLVLLFIL